MVGDCGIVEFMIYEWVVLDKGGVEIFWVCLSVVKIGIFFVLLLRLIWLFSIVCDV